MKNVYQKCLSKWQPWSSSICTRVQSILIQYFASPGLMLKTIVLCCYIQISGVPPEMPRNNTVAGFSMKVVWVPGSAGLAAFRGGCIIFQAYFRRRGRERIAFVELSPFANGARHRRPSGCYVVTSRMDQRLLLGFLRYCPLWGARRPAGHLQDRAACPTSGRSRG